MRCLYLIILLMTLRGVQPARAQQPIIKDLLLREPADVFTVVEKQPEFPGGYNALQRYIRRNNRYPAAARKAGVAGRVFISFVINTDGSIQDVYLLKGLGFGCDEQAIRLVAHMPRWIPGSQAGKPIRVRYNLPVSFGLPFPRSTRTDRRQPPPEAYQCSFSE